ncbi:hypothetical protein Clacol_010033 [Clathrus columnatus]|uniref:Ubiquitin-like domain-containing protein n=1 Tax=Clathrus columnatus TaxID=1419009 RepID=A0AAV5ASP9_9AGAM|nr:hypothetical protein Clacol_010033 [Clathrus columnatus]
MPTLSEKARGKQRADAVEPESVPETNNPSKQRELTIRFTEGVEDLTVYVVEKETVRDIKAKIRAQRTELLNRRLRLIYSGRLLTDGALLYPLITSSEERQRRAQGAQRMSSDKFSDNDNHHTSWLHCSIGPVMEIGEEEGASVQTSQIRPLRGFDRLQAAGFSAEDIASIRRQFHSESSNGLGDVDLDTEELDEQAQALEEQWIDSIDSAGSVALSEASSSTSSTVLQGLLIGFFFPLIPFLYFNETRPPAFWENEGLMPRPTMHKIIATS